MTVLLEYLNITRKFYIVAMYVHCIALNLYSTYIDEEPIDIVTEGYEASEYSMCL